MPRRKTQQRDSRFSVGRIVGNLAAIGVTRGQRKPYPPLWRKGSLGRSSRGCIAGLVAYLVWKGIRRLLFLLKLWLKYDLPKLPQKAGVAAAAAVDSAKSVKDAFVEGYKNKR
jgi:hypothetical protein